MQLSIYQKGIANSVNQGRIGSFLTFIDNTNSFVFLDNTEFDSTFKALGSSGKVIEEFRQQAFPFTGVNSLLPAAGHNQICVSKLPVNDITDRFTEFVSLLRELEDHKLVHIIQNKGPQERQIQLWYYSYDEGVFRPMDRAMQFYLELSNHTFNKLPALPDFISNGFMTEAEIARKKEERNRNATLIVAIIALIISIVSSFLTAIIS